jgi:hypothetical protein
LTARTWQSNKPTRLFAKKGRRGHTLLRNEGRVEAINGVEDVNIFWVVYKLMGGTWNSSKQ